MDHNSRTAFCKQAQGVLVTSLVIIVSSLVTVCTSTPIPPQEPIHPSLHYERLVANTETLHDRHALVYREFRTIRHNDPAIRVDDFTIQGIPGVDSLPSGEARFSMEESLLLPIHYRSVQAFVNSLTLAIQDEIALRMTGDHDFDSRLRSILLLMERVESKLRQTMQRLEIELDYDTRPAVTFTINENSTYLNMRILFVLQELNHYMVPLIQDFVNCKNRHNTTSS
ncbi:uncharacterized protein LOC117303514 [Asterias rubens]|uniref:uncharacterized protein LOC117303514 n=1 Tax=Asterias rubens TaxID=7604 RepID=UPI0014553E76|nr:uncharacterized protein LOC117303514 [Asterias rubens]